MNQFEKALERYLTPCQLEKIRSVKIGIAGAGGLGSNCAHMLVRTGFKRFRIYDYDILDHSNLNRQFYFLDQTGTAKVAQLKDNLLRINPEAEIEVIAEKIVSENAQEVFADCDIVVEAFDHPEYKKLIVEAYISSGKFLVAASGLAGWGNSDRIRVHKIKDNFYIVGDLKTGISKECPPLAPCVHIAAAKQADLILTNVIGSCSGGLVNET